MLIVAEDEACRLRCLVGGDLGKISRVLRSKVLEASGECSNRFLVGFLLAPALETNYVVGIGR